MRIKDKVAVVTGAGSGIGRASAELFAEEGARVAVADINVEGGRETVAAIEKAGGEAFFVETDVSRGPEVKALVESTVDRWSRLDIMVNNAGVNLPCLIHEEESEDIFDRTVAVNYKGTFYGCKYAVVQMLRQGKGAIAQFTKGISYPTYRWI